MERGPAEIPAPAKAPVARHRLAEGALAVAALFLGLYFLSLRIRAAGLPLGDQGSWLSVAAELVRGHGFTTQWLEYHWQTPYVLPRPDDFRYPALTSILALSFLGGGISYRVALWTVAGIFLGFALCAYLFFRSAHGRWPAMAALWLMSASLLQLEWNSAVYTEGLFGLVLVLVARFSTTGRIQSRAWWGRLGAGVGLLYLVRPNGILFAPGIALLFLRRRRGLALGWDRPALAYAALLGTIAPWLIRTWVHFGNPFHIAGSAGLLMDGHGQPHTYSLWEYLSGHDALFPAVKMAVGAWRLLETLHFFEHGLELAPLALAVLALFLRQPFHNAFLASGFLFSFAACAYAGYNSWAGLRYFSAMMPFLYAYGLASVPALAAAVRELSLGHGRRRAWPAGMTGVMGAAGLILLLLPVVNPHRFYARKYAHPPDPRPEFADHLARLEALLPPGGRYYAGDFCRLNFQTGRDCVGLQELYDSTWFSRSMRAFHPGWVALTHAETGDSSMGEALARMRAEGYRLDTLAVGGLGVYYGLKPAGVATP